MTSPVGAAKWAKFEKSEVEAEVYFETKPMQLCSSSSSLLLLLLLMMMLNMMVLFLKQNERFLEVRIAAYIFTIGTKYRSKIQAIWRDILLLIQLANLDLIYMLKAHFHTFDILHWKQITLSHVFVTFKIENSGHNVFEPRNIFHH